MWKNHITAPFDRVASADERNDFAAWPRHRIARWRWIRCAEETIRNSLSVWRALSIYVCGRQCCAAFAGEH